MTVRVGFVSSEGGPYLIADAASARNWRGIDGPDYDELCSQMDAHTDGVLNEFRLPSSTLLTWEPGAGVADVLVDTGRVVLAHPSDARVELPASMDLVGIDVMVESGVLAILWAPENGECIKDQDFAIQKARPPSGLLAVDGSSLLVPVVSGIYRCSIFSNGIDGQNVSCVVMLRK